MSEKLYEVRADYDEKTVVVYQAYASAVADPALKHQRFVAPFATDRMTWIKTSFLWLMHRSDWGRSANMERTLAVRIKISAWNEALARAVLTTPDPRVSIAPSAWRKAADKTDVMAQWDPERSLRDEKLDAKSLQVGLKPAAVEHYVKTWIVGIEDLTQRVAQIRALRAKGDWDEARKKLPRERVLPLSAAATARLVPQGDR